MIIEGRGDVCVQDGAKSWCAIRLHDLVEGKTCVADGVGSGVCSEGTKIGVSALEERREGMLLAGGNMYTKIQGSASYGGS